MIVYHHDLEWHAEILGCYIQGEVQNNHNMTVSSIFSELMILLQPTLV